MLETIERAYRHRLTPPIVAGALLAALDVPLVAGVFAIVLFVVVLEAVKQAAREGAEKAIEAHVYPDDADEKVANELRGVNVMHPKHDL